ncbi:unnamed protein product [Hermetia illucens]|uniref:DOMON domain-containing protein n=1 Tax=Hermetia illucens TaxID=343691 RepID=A0A7R8UMZ5_HERIL|nr:unnamed protein product [Hermetia illucens]
MATYIRCISHYNITEYVTHCSLISLPLKPPWWYNPTTTTPRPKANNCRELLSGRLQVKWEIQGEFLFVELFGRIKEDQYMAFGLSGAQGRPEMIGADVVVAFYDTTKRVFMAEDYYISHLAQCDGKQGVCPDERIGGKNDIIVLSGDRKNGVTHIKYKRLLQTNEPINDLAIPNNRDVSVIAAIGPLNARKEANAHSHSDVNADDIRIEFNSKNDHSCTSSLYDIKDKDDPEPWPTRILAGTTSISARIGPTGGKRGYTALTGHPSWGIAWYLNDLLIPELYVERGETYIFSVEGGNNPAQPARYHPFYITDSPEGGFGQKSAEAQRQQTVYAGVDYDSNGYPFPTAAGRYCEWVHKGVDKSAVSETFEDYMKTVELECEGGEPAILNWTVPDDAPNLLFYQCYTHNNLGWKIHIVDRGQPYPFNSTSTASTHLQIAQSPIHFIFLSTLFTLIMLKTIIINYKIA